MKATHKVATRAEKNAIETALRDERIKRLVMTFGSVVQYIAVSDSMLRDMADHALAGIEVAGER